MADGQAAICFTRRQLYSALEVAICLRHSTERVILLGLETLAALKRRANTGLFNWPDTTLATGQEVDLEGLALSMSGLICGLCFKVALDSLLGVAEAAD